MRSCKSHVDAVASLPPLLNERVGCFSKPKGGTLPAPEKKTKMSSIEHSSSPSIDKIIIF